MNALRFIKPIQVWIYAILFLFPTTTSFAQFQRIYGNAQENYFTKIIPDGSEFYVLGVEAGNATVTRLGSKGQHLWTRGLTIPSGFTDAVVMPNTGDLMFVGFTLPFNISNKSILGVVTPLGIVASIVAYDTPGIEGFSRIVVNPGGNSFSVLGFHAPQGTQEVVFLEVDANANITSKQRFPGTDSRFANDLEVIPLGPGVHDFLIAGAWSTTGVLYQMSSAGAFVNGVSESDPYTFQYVTRLANGDFFASMNSNTNAAPRLVRFDANLFPIWDVEVPGLDNIYQIEEGSAGDLYAIGSGTVNGINRAVLMKLNDNGSGINQPVPVWKKYLSNTETSYTGGFFALLQSGNIAFADGRTGNPNGLGQDDAFFAVTNSSFTSNCTVVDTFIIQLHQATWNGPGCINLLTYDPPPGTDLDMPNIPRTIKGACGVLTPGPKCADFKVLVEPDQDSRVIYYDGVGVEGDNISLVCDPPPGSVLPVGETNVLCTAFDTSGNEASCAFTVTVEKMPYDSLQPPPTLSPDGLFDRVRDRFGNPYRLSDLQIPEAMGGSLLCLNSGYFNLYFEPGCGMEGSSQVEQDRRNVLCQLFSDLSQFIDRPPGATDKVNIWVRDISKVPGTTPNHLGLATSFYVAPATVSSTNPFKGGILDGEVWKTINSGVDSYTGVSSPLFALGGSGAGFYHGMVAFNFANTNIQWYTTLSTTPPAFNEYDLYTVALHEATHALGFASLITSGGGSAITSITTYGGFSPFAQYYSRYDTYLRTAQNLSGGIGDLPLITNTGACSPMFDYQFNPLLTQSVLHPGSTSVLDYTDCPKAVRFVAPPLDQKVYTPDVFEGGSSLSHFEDGCPGLVWTPSLNNYNFVMSNANGPGPAYLKRFLRSEEREALCALGYKIAGTYGNPTQLTFHDYFAATCPGIGVAGVNDGISSGGTFTYMLNTNSSLPGINILGNDIAASYECLEVVYGGGSASPTIGTGTITYNSFGTTPGVKLLRYVPVSASGKRGNLTYVFILVKGPGCSTTGTCDQVSNGGFEMGSNCCLLAPVGTGKIDCWEVYCGSPDVLTRNCTTTSGCQVDVSTYNSIPPTGTHNGPPNDNILGLFAVNSSFQPSIYSEAVQTQLAAPLIPGQQYQISFWAKVNNNINGPSSNIPAHIQFAAAASFPLVAISSNAYSPTGPLQVLIQDITVPNNNQWHYLTGTFTFGGFVPFSNLIVAYPGPSIGQGTNGYVFLDDISLVPTSALPTFTPNTPVCLNDPPSNLNNTVSIPGGVFTGPGVVPGYSFDPALAGIGNHVITYTATDPNGCTVTATATIQVAQGPTVLFANLVSPQCLNDLPTILDNLVSPTGGTFSGPGVSCSPTNSCSFSPTNAGVGTHTITYTYSGGACPVSVTTQVTVVPCIDTCEITNNCLDFDGMDDYVDVPNPLNTSALQNNFTVACWFRDDRTSGSPADLFRLFGFGWNGPRFELGDQGGLLTFYGLQVGIVQSVNIRDGKWHHVAAVKNGNFVTIYLDGLPAQNLVNLNVGTFTGSAQNFHIGDWAGGASNPRFWQGRIDEFKVWGAVLSQAQIQDERYCSLDPNNSNLLVHFPFEQPGIIPWGNNLGNTLADNVVNGGLDGTLVNFSLTTGNNSNWVGRERDLLPKCNVDHFAWLEGDNDGNYAGRSKVFDADIFTAGQQLIPAPGNPAASFPVFTRRQADGTVVWRTMLNIEGVINDFTRTDEGCYLLVGYTPKYNPSNQSFIARVGPDGMLHWLHTYDFGDRESLSRIIRSDNPSNPLYQYTVTGIVHTMGIPLATYDDVLLFTIDNQGNIGWMRKLGDAAGNFTDDEFHADLINFQGGYALTGAYRNVQFYQPVIFQADNNGVQLASSSEYQQDIFFTDIEPSADGAGLIVAGKTASGDALLAKVDATGAQVWAKLFPNLRDFRRIVVQPNGDIFALGVRDGTLPNRNVVVKVRDFGSSAGVSWQKHAELPASGENNWGTADLTWYSGKMFFFTDTRYKNNNGWANGDIGATLYELDQLNDFFSFIKESQVPASQDFVLAKAQMAPLVGNLVTPPAPAISTPWTPIALMRDSLCASYGCECEFTNLSFSKKFGPPGWQVNVPACGLAPVALPGCPDQSSPIRFVGRLKCKGGCAFNGLSWVLTDPNGMQYSGNSTNATFYINITLAMAQVPAPGVYTIDLTGHCGTKTCLCTVQFTVPACPAPCVCTKPIFDNAVIDGFNWIQYPGCQFKFWPKSLSSCDAVQWLVAPAGNFNFTNFANTIGTNPASYTFPSTGQYVICMNVTRQQPNGATCWAPRCWTLDVDCSLLLKSNDDPVAENSPCDGSVVQNGGFTLGAEAGGLADIGSVWNWDYSAGNPEVVLEPGLQDVNFMRLRGNGGFADLLYQDSLPLSAGQRIQLSLAFRPIPALLLPGTELVVRVSNQWQDSLSCPEEATCHEILRLPIPELDSLSWLITGGYDSTTFESKFLTIHVENPFYADDVDLKSVVDIDNVCLRQFNFVSAKDENGPLLNVRIFPNPNTGTFTVELPQPASPGTTFRIIDITGRLALETKTGAGSAQQTIQAGNLPNGLYFLQVLEEGKVLAVEKFVKQ
ncbi:MAG: HYR domain-containing protein [Saprospiraceae bacterium]|nr:HYR domain-containing protein [Saprospiraceae bacterium]